jgi:hypothetical protein
MRSITQETTSRKQMLRPLAFAEAVGTVLATFTASAAAAITA